MSIPSAEKDQVATVLSVFRRWLAFRRTAHELALFNDRDLADLGLVRSDLERVGAFRAKR